MRKALFAVIVLLLAGSFSAHAEIPRLVAFQGRLTDAHGVPVANDTYQIFFRIYNDSTSGDLLWEEEQPVKVRDGQFEVNLGVIEPLPITVFNKGVDFFVAIRLAGEAEMAPRIRLTSAVFAYHALAADTAGLALRVPTGSVTGTMIKNYTIGLIDLAGNGADSGQVMKWNGSIWAIDDDQTGGSSGGGGWVDDGAYVRLEASTDYVGIGTDTPTQRLHLYGSGAAGIDLENGMAAEKWRMIVPSNGNLRFHEIPNAVDVLNLTSTGLVGIGTSSPAARLHINNSGTEDPFGVSISTQYKLIVKDDGRVGINTDSPMARLHIEEDGAEDLLRARVSGTTRFIVENNGQTGVGILNPATRLHVNETGASDPFRVDVNVSTKFAVKNDGRVGIGTSAPDALLEITGGIGSADVLIEADTDNSNENDQPSLTFRQDGGTTEGKIGFFGGTNDFTVVNQYSTGELRLATNSLTRLTIQSDGDVGIGTTNPEGHRLKVVSNASGSTGTTGRFINNHPSGIALAAEVNSTDLSCLISQLGSGDILRCDSYTGGWHPVFKVANDGTTTCPVLEITGGSDLAEPFEVNGETAAEPGMVVCIDPDHPGQLRIADSPYDPTVAGIISGANDLSPGLTMTQTGTIAEGSYPVALTGRVYCWVDAALGAIKPGDFLTTSPTPGHAMKAGDRDKSYGTVIGKAMTALPEGQGLVLVLVNLQ